MTEIKGLQVTIPGPELANMSHRAAAYHKAKAAECETKAEEMAKLMPPEAPRTDDELKGYYASSNRRDPVQEWKDRAAQHHRRERFHAFIATHVVSEAAYMLAVTELAYYGIEWAR